MNKSVIRMVKASDIEEIRSIYQIYIHTTITFEYELPSKEDFYKRVNDICVEYPYLVCEQDGKVVGYAYGHRQFERSAYQWDAELTVYIKPEYEGLGIGKRLYMGVIELLKLQNVQNVYALITEENKNSIYFHQNLRFDLCGRMNKTGYKNNKWLDVLWYEKCIGVPNSVPGPFIGIQELSRMYIEDVLRRINID